MVSWGFKRPSVDPSKFKTPRGPGRSVPLNIVVEFRLLSSQEDLYLIIYLGKKVLATARFFMVKLFFLCSFDFYPRSLFVGISCQEG